MTHSLLPPTGDGIPNDAVLEKWRNGERGRLPLGPHYVSTHGLSEAQNGPGGPIQAMA